MIPWEHLDTAQVPGGGELKLMRRGTEHSIMSGAIELMNSRLSGSEEALATLSCEALKRAPAPQVLIGGFGMGFTLRAALALLPPAAGVVVAELVPAVVAWARGPLAELFAGSLDDPRVRVFEGDVADAIAEARGSYDAILLDVDNGAGGLSRAENDRLYDAQGLAAARVALKPGGVLAVWSANPDSGFVARLKRAGYAVEEKRARATRSGRGARHIIWLARPQPPGAPARDGPRPAPRSARHGGAKASRRNGS